MSVDASPDCVEVAPLDLDGIDRRVEDERGTELHGVKLRAPRGRQGRENPPRMPVRPAMRLQHAYEIRRGEPHELGPIARVGSDRPEQGGAVPCIENLR